jgi:hypothetical protein
VKLLDPEQTGRKRPTNSALAGGLRQEVLAFEKARRHLRTLPLCLGDRQGARLRKYVDADLTSLIAGVSDSRKARGRSSRGFPQRAE